MNIFVLDNNIELCAKYHCDKHVVKMVIEYAQLLSNAHHLNPGADYMGLSLCKLTHENHPCTKWVCESLDNYLWLFKLWRALCIEYTKRYGKVHQIYLNHFRSLIDHPNLQADNPEYSFITKHVLCMPEYCKKDNVIESYRCYYMTKKRHVAKWKNGVPEWYS